MQLKIKIAVKHRGLFRPFAPVAMADDGDIGDLVKGSTHVAREQHVA